MSELPPGWCWVAIRDIGDVRLGRQRSPDRATGPHMRPYMRAANVTWEGISLDDVKEMDFSPDEFEVFALLPGDVLVGEASGSRLEVGKSAIWRGEVPGACFQNTLIRVRVGGAVLPEYLQKHLAHDARRGALADISKGIGIHHIGAAGLAEWQISLAPLPEQKRIADKLDTLLARVGACRERLDRVPGILKRFRQSVLAAATSGELTREWREERGLDGEWQIVDVESVASDFSYGSAAKSSKVGKVPVLRMGNIQDGLLDWGDLVFTSDAAEISKYRLSNGDVLFNRTNSPELVGKTAVFRGERDAIYAGYLIRVRCGERLLPDYLNYCLGSPAGREYCWQVKSDGVSQSNINARKLAAFTFGLPSVEEQQEIIRRVEDLLALNLTLGAKIGRARVLVDRLTPSALAMAFRGELVAQDPNDEPASALLNRIREVPEQPTKRLPASRSRKTRPRKEFSAMGKKLIDVLAEAGDWMTAQEAFRGCISEGATTDLVESIYAELRELERNNRVAVEPVRNALGVKVHDRLKLIVKS